MSHWGELMTKKQVVITLIILLFVISAMISLFWGSPVKRYNMKNQLKAYVLERYGANYYMSDFEFDFIHRTYHAYFTSNKGDLTFYVGQDNVTEEINDGYDYEREKLNKQLE